MTLLGLWTSHPELTAWEFDHFDGFGDVIQWQRNRLSREPQKGRSPQRQSAGDKPCRWTDQHHPQRRHHSQRKPQRQRNPIRLAVDPVEHGSRSDSLGGLHLGIMPQGGRIAKGFGVS